MSKPLTASFVVKGKPRSKLRARVARARPTRVVANISAISDVMTTSEYHKLSTAVKQPLAIYTPSQTTTQEKLIAWTARAQKCPLFKGPLCLQIKFGFGTAIWDRWGKPHTNTPDLSNLVKCVEDALNGIAYTDDRQIVDLHAEKLWVYEADEGTHITLVAYDPQ